MNGDMTAEQCKKKIGKLLSIWSDRLNLSGWKLSYEWVDGIFEDDSSSISAVARTEIKWEYKIAHIEFSIQKLMDCEDTELNRIAVHELMHVIVNEMREYAGNQDSITVEQYNIGIKHEERVIEELCSIIIKAYDQLDKINYINKNSKKRNSSKSRTKEK